MTKVNVPEASVDYCYHRPWHLSASRFEGQELAESRIVYRQSFVKAASFFDDYGHGTHVAGIAASNGVHLEGGNARMPGLGLASHLLCTVRKRV